jgi:hypothetical protein
MRTPKSSLLVLLSRQAAIPKTAAQDGGAKNTRPQQMERSSPMHSAYAGDFILLMQVTNSNATARCKKHVHSK